MNTCAGCGADLIGVLLTEGPQNFAGELCDQCADNRDADDARAVLDDEADAEAEWEWEERQREEEDHQRRLEERREEEERHMDRYGIAY